MDRTIYWKIKVEDRSKRELERVAKREDRTEVDMVRILIKEALEAREEREATNKQKVHGTKSKKRSLGR